MNITKLAIIIIGLFCISSQMTSMDKAERHSITQEFTILQKSLSAFPQHTNYLLLRLADKGVPFSSPMTSPTVIKNSLLEIVHEETEYTLDQIDIKRKELATSQSARNRLNRNLKKGMVATKKRPAAHKARNELQEKIKTLSQKITDYQKRSDDYTEIKRLLLG